MNFKTLASIHSTSFVEVIDEHMRARIHLKVERSHGELTKIELGLLTKNGAPVIDWTDSDLNALRWNSFHVGNITVWPEYNGKPVEVQGSSWNVNNNEALAQFICALQVAQELKLMLESGEGFLLDIAC